MASKLTKKQMQQLEDFDHQTLLNIITDLIENYPEVREQIINQCFTQPTKYVQKIATKYKRQLKSQRFFDYYATDHFFKEQIKTLLLPLNKFITVCPVEIEKLTFEMILSFEQLTESKDTSSGSWQDYFVHLYNIYLTALINQPNLSAQEIAQKIYQIANIDPWFQFDAICNKKNELGVEVLSILRDLFLSDDNQKISFSLSIMIKDTTTATIIWEEHKSQNKCRFLGTTESLLFCELLIDELNYEQAIEVLNELNENSTRFNSVNYEKWCQLLVKAMHSRGQHDQALELIKQAFRKSPTNKIWSLYLSIGGNEQRDYPLFQSLAAESGPNSLINFLEQLDDYATINDILTGKREYSINDFKNNGFKPERKLSTKLNKLGFYQGAIILRRLSAELTINNSSASNYSFAVTDIQKAIEFALNSQDGIWIQSNQDWLMRLYERHARKYKLWQIIQEKLEGITIENNSLIFS